jgi:hypothetical protein
MSGLQGGKLKITISVEKWHRFKGNYSCSSSHQTRKKKQTPLPSLTVTITPATTTVGHAHYLKAITWHSLAL